MDIHSIDVRRNQIQGYLDSAEKICDQQKKTSTTWQICDNLREVVQKNLNRIQNMTELIHSIYKIPTYAKRGIIDGIGTIAKSLFGVMDANDEKIITEQIDLLQNKQETLQHAVTNQLKIINTTVHNLDTKRFTG
ncbi:uncharacterized protein LOC116853686 [Odontomachus brunneus]|uniref:uncharacterized protein LOC116846826 n=1 Tax=Odontomachus brunneus TaxID=486640 RepID=UPI0013F1C10A|nr:uncharacterized protein LOC116846826 [Odontomachus brunneus]XP_032690744.1 uncharacterized protein LOC116853686 [Odontomachus brunneus]